jgi:Domain of unknown function (DUF2383)
MTNSTFSPVTLVITSLTELSKALMDAKRKCEEIERRVRNEQLRKTLINLEQLNSQYARELISQIYSMGGGEQPTEPGAGTLGSFAPEIGEINVRKETLNICSKVEYPIIKLYRKILRQPFLSTSLKKTIQYQMNGVMCSTLQLKLLSKFLQN